MGESHPRIQDLHLQPSISVRLSFEGVLLSGEASRKARNIVSNRRQRSSEYFLICFLDPRHEAWTSKNFAFHRPLAPDMFYMKEIWKSMSKLDLIQFESLTVTWPKKIRGTWWCQARQHSSLKLPCCHWGCRSIKSLQAPQDASVTQKLATLASQAKMRRFVDSWRVISTVVVLPGQSSKNLHDSSGFLCGSNPREIFDTASKRSWRDNEKENRHRKFHSLTQHACTWITKSKHWQRTQGLQGNWAALIRAMSKEEHTGESYHRSLKASWKV